MKTILLQGVVGSTAYGLNRPDSDKDQIGVFVYDRGEYYGLNDPDESIVTKDPDLALHEARKYCRLVLKCNPTVMELLWLESYETITLAGANLVGLRRYCLSEQAVREAYLGYAKSQLNRLHNRQGDLNEKRVAKHAMHMARLTNQGMELYTTGQLTIKVADPDWYVHFSKQSTDYWTKWYSKREAEFRSSKCILPERAQPNVFADWYYKVRMGQI